jgi:hypothetical protein
MNLWHDLQWVLPLRTPALTQLAFGLSWLGYTTFIMFFIAIGYWTWNRAIFYRLLILVAFNALLNAYAKDWIQDPRPPLAIRLDDLVGASYGLPSGHAQIGTVLWMWLAWELRRTGAWVLCSLIAVGVMASRLYLGVHDLEDVVGGALLGATTLVLFEATRSHSTRLQSHPAWGTVLVAMITGLALWSWPGDAPEYLPTLATWLVVATWCQHYERPLGFTVPNTPWKRVAAGLLGAVCFLGEQKIVKWAGIHHTLDPVLWAALKGVVNGGFVCLLVPWWMHALNLTPPLPNHGGVLQNKP